MSGGVDSSVAAYLLKQQGFDVHGVFMRTWHSEDDINPVANCPWRTDMEDARRAAESIDITFEVVNMIKHYEKFVVTELINGYKNGITPNPDILCNQFIKFGLLSEYVKNSGYDYIATGHYCKKRNNADETFDIVEGDDKNKDQSYFLARLQQHQLKNILFPVGNIDKPTVRKIATDANLDNATKKDSQGICFLGKVKIQDFLSHYIQESPGEIITSNGRIIGNHSGLFKFTIGQRHGINLPSNTDNKHYVVVGKDIEKNHLIVEIERDDSNNLYCNKIKLRDITFLNKPIASGSNILVRPRYRDKKQEAVLHIFQNRSELQSDYQENNITGELIFKTNQRALAAGQVAAFYDEKETLLGSGIYC